MDLSRGRARHACSPNLEFGVVIEYQARLAGVVSQLVVRVTRERVP